jgi:protease-4
MPPPMFRPYRPGGFFRRAVVTLLLVLLLIDLVGINLIILAAVSATAQSRVRQVSVVDNSSDQTIVAIPIEGLITDDSATQFDQFLTAAAQDKNVKAVVLEIDTPGGMASAADAMHHRLERFKAENKIPVVVSMGSLATSGGYYLACGADYIFAEPSTMTADIGVLMPRFNVSDLMAKYGVKETTIVSTGAPYKNMGSMFEPEDPMATAYLQGLTDAIFEQFKKVVSDGRKGKLAADTTNIFNGRVYMAADALALGLIDKIGYPEDAYDYAKSAAGLSAAKVVRYESSPLLQRLLGADSLSSVTGAKTESGATPITVNGVGVDIRHLSDFLTPRPMYLWQGN